MISNMLHRKPSRASYITEFSVFLSKLRPFPRRQFNHRFKETPEGASNVTQQKEEVTGMEVVQLPLELVDGNDFQTHHSLHPKTTMARSCTKRLESNHCFRGSNLKYCDFI